MECTFKKASENLKILGELDSLKFNLLVKKGMLALDAILLRTAAFWK